MVDLVIAPSVVSADTNASSSYHRQNDPIRQLPACAMYAMRAKWYFFTSTAIVQSMSHLRSELYKPITGWHVLHMTS
jgi:hypothetical protein